MSKETSTAKRRLIGYALGCLGLVGLTGTGVLVSLLIQEEPELDGPVVFESQESQVVEDVYPSGHIGYGQEFWAYDIMSPETEYDTRQQLLNEGGITLWPDVSTTELMWFSGHNPGTFGTIAEHVKVGEHIVVTSPPEYEERHQYDDPALWTYEIVERLETDIWAEETFETTQKRATDMYNELLSEPMIVLQHSGEEEDSVVLYLGELIDVVDLSAE